VSAQTVALTGATGDVGVAVLAALEGEPRVGQIRAMARRPFSPALFGFRKVRYQRGDVRSETDVRQLVSGADVVVHLAFALHGSRRRSASTNLGGSQLVFEEAVRAGVSRLCCASSIGGYGTGTATAIFDEEAPFEGVPGHPYSEQKAAMERSMAGALAGSGISGYSLRLALVAGPGAQLMLRQIPYVRLRAALPGADPPHWLRPVLPDTGVPLQLVHEEDAGAAFAAAALGDGAPGAYNIAAEGTVTVGDLARELGWRSLSLPRGVVDRAARATRRFANPALAWLEVARAPVLVGTERARRGLDWSPRFTAHATLEAMVGSYRRHGMTR